MTSDQNSVYSHGIWLAKREGKSVIYEYTEIYSGAPGPITRQLSLERYAQINRIEQIWDDATAKDASIRVLARPSDTYFTTLQSLTVNVSTSEALQLGPEYKYPSGARLDFVHENYTDAKIFKIIVQVDEV